MSLVANVRLLYDPLLHFVRIKKNYKPGEYLIVQTEFGNDIATIVSVFETETYTKRPEYKLVREATVEEINNIKKNISDANEALKIIREKAEQYKLPMNTVLAHYLFDRTKLLFFFVSETRVDFRALVKDLALTFHTRIELRQIPPRDATKLAGGCGTCGLELCCHRFKISFDNISLKYAREQNLSTNISKLNGICGKPFCCLSYEHEQYIQMSKMFPKINSQIKINVEKLPQKIITDNDIKELTGTVKDFNVIKETVLVRLETDAILEIPLTAVKH